MPKGLFGYPWLGGVLVAGGVTTLVAWFLGDGSYALPILAGLASASMVGIVLAILQSLRQQHHVEQLKRQFEGLLRAIPDPVVISAADGRIVLVNEQALAVFGYSHQEFYGLPIERLFSPRLETRANISLDLSTATTTPKEDSDDLFGKRKDGSTLDVLVSFSPAGTAESPLVVHVIRDVTVRKKRESRRAARNAARRVFATGLTVEDACPRFLEAIGSLLGWDVVLFWVGDGNSTLISGGQWHSSTLPHHLGEAAEGEGVAGTATRLVRAIRQGEAIQESLDFPGDLRLAVGVPVVCDGNVFGVLELFRREASPCDEALLDTLVTLATEWAQFQIRRRAEKTLRLSEARKAAILDAALDSILTVDREGQLLEINVAAERLFGRSREQLLSMKLDSLLGVPQAGEPTWISQGQRHRRESLALGNHGEKIPVEVAIVPIVCEGPQLYTAHIHDLRERKSAEKALAHAEEQARQAHKLEAVGRLAGGVAHDFNNLLTIITGFGDQLLAMATTGEAHEYAEAIVRAGQRAANLTRQLLAIGRRQMVHPIVLELNAVIRDVLPVLQRLAGDGIVLQLPANETVCVIEADPTQLEQVLMNLVTNARDAMRGQGIITINTARVRRDTGAWVELSVADRGCGMDEETKKRIFEPFFTTKGVGEGTGLGLATVYGIVHQCFGQVEVETELGQGTTFRILFPEAQTQPVPPTPILPGPHSPQRGTILLAEDETDLRVLVRKLLLERGYSVLEAPSGEAALAEAVEHPGEIDLLLTDVVMPGLSGITLARRLVPQRPGLRVLYMSGYTHSIPISHGIEETQLPFLPKPFTPEELLRAVDLALSAARSEADRMP